MNGIASEAYRALRLEATRDTGTNVFFFQTSLSMIGDSPRLLFVWACKRYLD